MHLHPYAPLCTSYAGWYPPMHGFGSQTYNWNCGRGFYDTSGCDGESEYAVNNMPDSVEMIYRWRQIQWHTTASYSLSTKARKLCIIRGRLQKFILINVLP